VPGRHRFVPGEASSLNQYYAEPAELAETSFRERIGVFGILGG
jgi:hypothetical protein